MPEVDPITREEKLWNGEDIEPITREEQYIKHIYDKTQKIPSKPITRKEVLLEKAGQGGGSDVTIKQLSVTENGTYSEENTAYSPVIVNVPAPPIPDNAYLLNEVEGLPKDIATFSDGANLPMPSLKVGIEPIQEGSGDPSPTNIRPISGHTEVNMSVSGVNVWDEETEFGYYDVRNGIFVSNANQLCAKNFIPVKPNMTLYGYKGSYTGYGELLFYDKSKNYISYLSTTQWINKEFTVPSNCFYVTFNLGSASGTTYNNDISINYPSTDTTYHAYNGQTYTIDLDGTRYGGTLDVVSGVLTVDRASIKLSDLTWTKQNTINNNWRFKSSQSIQNIKLPTDASQKIDNLCSVYQNVTANETWTADKTGIAVNADGTLLICDLNQANTTALGVVIANQTIVYELATPLTIQLTPTAVKSLLGSNNVWADTGEIEELEYFGKEV